MKARARSKYPPQFVPSYSYGRGAVRGVVKRVQHGCKSGKVVWECEHNHSFDPLLGWASNIRESLAIACAAGQARILAAEDVPERVFMAALRIDNAFYRERFNRGVSFLR